MPRTPAQAEAAQRDIDAHGPFCLWSKYKSDGPSLLPGTDLHHLGRRQPGADVPQCIVTLNHVVHMRHHMGFSPTTSELLDLMKLIYDFDLRLEFPAFFAGY